MGDPMTKLEGNTQYNEVTGTSKGPQQELYRSFSFLSLLGLAFAIVNTWTAAAASLSLALPSGGPTAVVWGMWVSGLGAAAMAASLGEICHIYPTAGGQYHCAALLATPKYARLTSWIAGWLSCAGWWSLVGTNGSLAGQLITGLVPLFHPDIAIERWHIYIVYLCFILISSSINLFGVRALPHFNTFALYWSLIGVILVIIVSLSTAKNYYSSGGFVFKGFINETGWSDGVSWILGLLQSTFALTAFDSCMHLVEEVPQPEMYAPTGMVMAIGIGTLSGFVFLIALLFCVRDVDAVNSAATGSLLQIYYQATSNRAGSLCLLLISIGCQFFACAGAVTTASRMTWAFARDEGLPLSNLFRRVNHTLRVPVWAIGLTALMPILYGVVYIGSTSAFNAIISSSVIFLNFSYALPIAILVVRGRSILEPAHPNSPKRRWTLGRFGWPINIFALIFCLVTSVFFCFPPETPVTGLNMNYSVVVLSIVGLLSLITWITTGHKHFAGPRDIDGLIELSRKNITIEAQDHESHPR